jgi:hypothetical protein
MSSLTDSLAHALTGYFRDYLKRVRTLADPLTEEQFWKKPYGYGNSFGHLTLHLTGNLSYYIGARIAGTGYVRDRPREFTDPSPPSKEEALRRLEEAVEMVVATIEKQTPESWILEYSAEGASALSHDRVGIVLNCITHFHHHLGQMIYLQKEWMR